MDIKKLDNNRFIVEKEQQMNTNIKIYANEMLIEKIKRDRTIQQAINATTLPGLVGDVLLMPDAHEGYGVAIGNVMAFDSENGIISPGSVGFDINCLHPETRVIDEHGAQHEIRNLKDKNVNLLSLDFKTKNIINTKMLLFLEKDGNGRIFKIKTVFGNIVLATEDHPILTKRGMVAAKDLQTTDSIVTSGFNGVNYNTPHEKIIVSKETLLEIFTLLGIKNTKRGQAIIQMLKLLHRLNLDEISSRHQKLPTLIKLLGFVFGDGTIAEVKKNTRRTSFYGKEQDMIEIKRDVESLGFKCLIQHRKRHHKITTIYKTYEFSSDEYSATVSSSAFTSLLLALGAPFGNKVLKSYRIPEWLMKAEDWQKRLFLASYFGAELSTPRTPNDHKFTEPYLRFCKSTELRNNGIDFLLDIKIILNSFGIETAELSTAEDYKYMTKKCECTAFRLRIFSNKENLMKLFGNVGFIYNKEKERLASLAYLYLSYLEGFRLERQEAKEKILQMHAMGVQTNIILREASTTNVSKSFIEHTLQGRISKYLPHAYGTLKFNDFVGEFEISKSGFCYNKIENIEEIIYKGKVYDLGIDNENHNFMANGIVVSNCGVRLIKTNLAEKDVRPKINQLSDALFKNIPSGVGSKFNIGLTNKDQEKIAEEGASYIIGKGFGFSDDIERIEENGTMMQADFSKVSREAKSRGLHELGTLGAGNHFLEVQKVEKILDENIAKAYGLHAGQIVVMVHTGSRGFGHQICSDYLRDLVEYQRKNNIKLIDPELSYAYIGSKEADDYLGAMRSAVNYAFTNRQIITNSIRKSFEQTFSKSADSLDMEILYDLSHNIVKLEEHEIDGKKTAVYVHRKGATRSFSKDRDEVPKRYRSVGQPVLIPGSMGTASYILCGAEGAMKETFGSACHGAGRVMSRHQAIRDIPAEKTFESLKKKNIEIRIRTRKLVSEEAEWTYKDVDEVIKVVKETDLSIPVTRNVPIAVIKG